METHRAFLVPEILNLIFQEIKHDKAALASAALTCRSLSSIAMDFLWKELETSTPIKRLLPNLWNVDGTYVSDLNSDLVLSQHIYIRSERLYTLMSGSALTNTQCG
jgi:hypothetical protein